ncbi:MAG: hypothetical protein KF838_02125 [Phycisphaeraceae bacterium]|nr:MAG: hypothetical protein KF838_02125 [Phycisphaeraceae bacterium]
MKFPTHDWQFYIATGIAIAALAFLFRRFIPFGRRSAGRRRQTTLTIEGRLVSQRSTKTKH